MSPTAVAADSNRRVQCQAIRVRCRPRSNHNYNNAEFCDRDIDREISEALSLQAGNPQAAARLWAKIDRDTTDQAPWLAYDNTRQVDFASARVGNYVYSAGNGGALLDQLWVR